MTALDKKETKRTRILSIRKKTFKISIIRTKETELGKFHTHLMSSSLGKIIQSLHSERV